MKLAECVDYVGKFMSFELIYFLILPGVVHWPKTQKWSNADAKICFTLLPAEAVHSAESVCRQPDPRELVAPDLCRTP